jgi:hypothetical protein
MQALAQTALGLATIDLDEDELVEIEETRRLDPPDVAVDLPLFVAADGVGSTIVAVVDRKPPLVVSHDAGTTWHEAGAGLPLGRAVAVSTDHPDRVLYASENRLFVSLDGGRFWQALTLELVDITAVAWVEER